MNLLLFHRPTSRSSGGTNTNNNGVALPVGLADDQAKDFDFEKTEMKYDSTGMFHWGPAKNLEDCILVSITLPNFNHLIACAIIPLTNLLSGPEPSGDDCPERSRSRLSIRRSRFPPNWFTQPGHAT